MKKNPSRFLFWRRRRRGGGGNRHRRDNIPCNLLADAVNLPCARPHSNARTLDVVLVDQCFAHCLVVRRDQRRSEKKEETRERERGDRDRSGRLRVCQQQPFELPAESRWSGRDPRVNQTGRVLPSRRQRVKHVSTVNGCVVWDRRRPPSDNV